MALTEREKWDRFRNTYPDVTADAFFWCSGSDWAHRRYCVVLSARSGARRIGLELKAKTPQELRALMADAGYRTTTPTVQRLCETAPRSPKRKSSKRKSGEPVPSPETPA